MDVSFDRIRLSIRALIERMFDSYCKTFSCNLLEVPVSTINRLDDVMEKGRLCNDAKKPRVGVS